MKLKNAFSIKNFASLLGAFVLSGFALSGSASADEMLYQCKKRDAFVYQTFYWATIEKKDSGELIFLYGNGIEDQILNVQFVSPISEIAPGQFHFDNGDFQVEVTVKKENLSFQIENEGRKSKRKGLRCEATIRSEQ